MSIIAARKNGNHIEIAADSQVAQGHERHLPSGIKYTKLFKNDTGLTIATAGNCTESVLMELFSEGATPNAGTRLGILDFMVAFYAWAAEKDPDLQHENVYLIVFEGRIFSVENKVEVHEINEFEAMGSGAVYAKTAMYLGQGARQSCEVAREFCIYCGGPIVTYTLTK